MNVSLTIEGMGELKELFDPETFKEILGEVVDTASELIRDDTKRLPAVSAKTTGYSSKGIPVDSGRLRQSINKRRVSLLAAEVYAPTNYSIYVHEGTSRMPARPFFQWTVEDFGGARNVETATKRIIQRYFEGR